MGSDRFSREELRQYWEDLSNACCDRDDRGLSLVSYAGMPLWFNNFFDRYQRKAFRGLIGDMRLRGPRVLDIGTGVGRWARWLASQRNTRVIGVDIERRRLKWAQQRSGDSIEYYTMSADHLAFPDATFDLVNCVAVLMHVHDDVKRAAISEMARVLKPNGQAIVFELIDEADDAPHVFPWNRHAWLEEFRANGFSLVRTVGEQYTPLLRLARAGFKRLRGSGARGTIDEIKRARVPSKRQHIYLGLLRLLIFLSYPAEELCTAFLPPRFARRNGYLFRISARR